MYSNKIGRIWLGSSEEKVLTLDQVLDFLEILGSPFIQEVPVLPGGKFLFTKTLYYRELSKETREFFYKCIDKVKFEWSNVVGKIIWALDLTKMQNIYMRASGWFHWVLVVPRAEWALDLEPCGGLVSGRYLSCFEVGFQPLFSSNRLQWMFTLLWASDVIISP